MGGSTNKLFVNKTFQSLIYSLFERMWRDGKIPYTYHWSIEEEPTFKARVETAIQKIEEASCLVFEDITDFMKEYLKDYEKSRNDREYFTKFKSEPAEYPHYIL